VTRGRGWGKCGLKSAGTGLARGGSYGYYWTQDFGSR
jgi:uncharacterized protein YkwD